jgi:hypothetical protein
METPNLSYIDELACDDQEFKDKMLSIIKAELPEEIDHYLQNIQQKEYKEAAESVHKIKHKITILGLIKTYPIAEKYEEDLKEGDANFHDDFMKILEVMVSFLNQL